jgi:hypothetical protein
MTGGATIDSYELSWLTAPLTWTVIVGFSPYSMLNTYTLAAIDGVVSGNSYTFRYRAHNAQGWSDYSASAVILAA